MTDRGWPDAGCARPDHPRSARSWAYGFWFVYSEYSSSSQSPRVSRTPAKRASLKASAPAIVPSSFVSVATCRRSRKRPY
jgi:hypothetical protein